MTTSVRLALATLVSLVYWVASVSIAGEEASIDAEAAFARLKTLKGEWKPIKGDDKHGHGDKKVIYSLTAAGSALVETQFPGSDHEMVTIYHLDGDDLKVTHYCALGNQPRMKLDLKNSKPDNYSFVFDGGTNLDPSKDMHIHNLRIKFVADGKVDEEWDGFEGGKLSGTTKISMVRE